MQTKIRTAGIKRNLSQARLMPADQNQLRERIPSLQKQQPGNENSLLRLRPYPKQAEKRDFDNQQHYNMPVGISRVPFAPVQFVNSITAQSGPQFSQAPSHIGQNAVNFVKPHLIASIPTAISTLEGNDAGYGTVDNPLPDLNPNCKVLYHNLYTIGKAWLKFEGSFACGMKEGPGTIYLTNGHVFTGFFVKDLANGKGSVYVDGELVLKGTWRDNLLVTEF